MSPLSAIVYSRTKCHLCEDAVRLLEEFGIHAREVNIDEDPELNERYSNWVPVIEINGRVRFRGRIDRRLLKRIVEAEGRK